MISFKFDPSRSYTEYSEDQLLQWCGFLPQWIAEADDAEGAIEAALEANYPFMPSHSMTGELNEAGEYNYPEDPTLRPLMTFENSSEIAFIFEYGIVGIWSKSQAKATFIKRLD